MAAVKTTATAEAAATVECVASAETGARKVVARAITRSPRKSVILRTEARTAVIAMAIIAAAADGGSTMVAPSIVGPRPAVVASAIVTVEPRTRANEDAVHKPVRAVIAVGRATIRVVVVITVTANGSRAVIDGAADSDGDADLRLRAAAESEEQQSEQRCVFEIAHFDLPAPASTNLAGGPVSFPASSPGEAAYIP